MDCGGKGGPTVLLAAALALLALGFWVTFTGIAPGATSIGVGCGIAFVLFVLVGVTTVPLRPPKPDGAPRYRETYRPAEPPIRFSPPPEERIEPRDETDPFCTCPSCGLAGTHMVEAETFRERTVPGRDGEPVAIPLAEDPPDGTRRAHRTCVFCGHVWHTRVHEETR